MRDRKRIAILGIVLLVILVGPVLGGDTTVVKPVQVDSSVAAENKPTLILTYQNSLLTADIKSCTIKEIFEELKKQVGINYEIEKEIAEQKVTISFKERELTQGIKDILNTIGNPSYMISYRKGKDGKDEVAGISIKRRGKISEEDLKVKKINKLTELLTETEDKKGREKVINELKNRDKEAIPELMEVARDKNRDRNVRVPAIMLLGQMKVVEAKKDIEDVLEKDNDALCREASAIVLAEIGDTTSIELLRNKLKDESGNVRQRAVLALAKLKQQNFNGIDMEILKREALSGIRSDNATESLLAVDSLEAIGDTAVIKELKVARLDARNAWTRINVRLAIKKIELKNIKKDKILDYLKEALKDEQFEINQWSAMELIKIDKKEAKEILTKAAGEGNYAARKILNMHAKQGEKK